jgi:prophage regulatory protein
MHRLPETGYVRLPQIIGDPNETPPTPAIIPVAKSTWWQGVKDGRFPKPVKLGPKTTAWRVEDIRSLIERLGARRWRIDGTARAWSSGCEHTMCARRRR